MWRSEASCKNPLHRAWADVNLRARSFEDHQFHNRVCACKRSGSGLGNEANAHNNNMYPCCKSGGAQLPHYKK